MLTLYYGLFYLLMPLILLRLFLRGRKAPAYRQRWSERLGFVPPLEQEYCLWIHAVSVGETIAAKPLVEHFLSNSSLPIWVTTTTPTGSEQVLRLFGDRVRHSYLPYDIPGPLKRFLKRAKPQALIVMETELWPGMVDQCQRMQVPVLLANGRMSEKSCKGYQRFGQLSRQLFSQLTLVAAQSVADAKRFKELGAVNVECTGSLKADVEISETLKTQRDQLRNTYSVGDSRSIVVAASTHLGEDEIILSVFKQLKATFPALLLVLVPRHPERFDQVATLCEASGFQFQRKTQLDEITAETDIVLGDTMGELLLICGIADVVIMGGTFVERGGHNFLEPAAWGVPIVAGTSDFNFAVIADGLRSAGGLQQSDDPAELAQMIQQLLKYPEHQQQRGRAGLNYVEQSRGALPRLISLLAPFTGK